MNWHADQVVGPTQIAFRRQEHMLSHLWHALRLKKIGNRNAGIEQNTSSDIGLLP